MKVSFSWVGWIDVPLLLLAMYAADRLRMHDHTHFALAAIGCAVLILAREVHDAARRKR